MSERTLLLIIQLVIVLCIIFLIYIIYLIFRNPFKYPYFSHTFDVTSKRNINIENYIDNFLRNERNWQTLQLHEKHIRRWKNESEEFLKTCKLKKYRYKQYNKVLDDESAYHFITIRKQTRYKQQNYVKTSYKVSVLDSEWAMDWYWLLHRRKKLEEIELATTLRDYNSKNQRRLMTPTLRKQIMQRDNYTCQICGKHMPDEVGLHIDHIIPIARDGKSVPSNLRVLCSKCNGSKGAK